MAGKPKVTTIDEYIAAVSDDQRVALERLRKTIKAAVPKAEECINYGVAAFRLNGIVLVGIGVSAKHCTFYPMSGRTVHDHQAELKKYKTTNGSIHFSPNKPLPASLVRKLIKARLAETEGQQGASYGSQKARRKN